MNGAAIDGLGLPRLPDGIMPFESWEKLKGESSSAFAAFCGFRDFGAERNVRKAAAASFSKQEQSEAGFLVRMEKRYRMWRAWATQHKWRERAEEYDRYIDGLKQTEIRKTIEARGEAHREVTGKMLQVVNKKLDLMDPADLSQGTVTEWVETAIRTEREIFGLTTEKDKQSEQAGKPGGITFTPDFEGL
jgi:hypothetical protein